jgi:hypothetical protein
MLTGTTEPCALSSKGLALAGAAIPSDSGAVTSAAVR